MPNNATKEAIGQETRIRELVEDGTEVLADVLAEWKRTGRMAENVQIVIARLSNTGITALLSDMRTIAVPFSDPSRAAILN